jgi:hypothetical protein
MYSVGKFDQVEVFYGNPIFLDSSEPDAAALERVQRGLDDVSACA